MEQGLRSVAVGAALVIAALAPVRAEAQQQSHVRGHVVDTNQQPVPNADVRVLRAGPEAITGPAGAFDLGSLAAGSYQVRVRRIGFRAVTVTVIVPMSRPELTVVMTPVPMNLDTVRAHALEEALPRVFEREREHLGGLVFGPELVKEHPGLSMDEILQTDSTLYPFLQGASLRGCHPKVYIDGKPMPRPMWTPSPYSTMHTILPDLDIRDFVRMKDVAAIEIFRYANGKIFEPRVPLGAGQDCGALILIWMKGYNQKPYKGP